MCHPMDMVTLYASAPTRNTCNVHTTPRAFVVCVVRVGLTHLHLVIQLDEVLHVLKERLNVLQ